MTSTRSTGESRGAVEKRMYEVRGSGAWIVIEKWKARISIPSRKQKRCALPRCTLESRCSCPQPCLLDQPAEEGLSIPP
ncbi:hypothetical protein [Rubrobacter xylanophilus]|uniref:hypothetical protein n=1 Tax=Rubrobacter xylanophilus TaxID=49319 RepID=UPI00155A5949|nr:hypothetical protein [Rubrobacter xylanophilus]